MAIIKKGLYRWNGALEAPTSEINQAINFRTTFLYDGLNEGAGLYSISVTCNKIQILQDGSVFYNIISTEPYTDDIWEELPQMVKVREGDISTSVINWWFEYPTMQNIYILEDIDVGNEFFNYFNANTNQKKYISGSWRRISDVPSVPFTSIPYHYGRGEEEDVFNLLGIHIKPIHYDSPGFTVYGGTPWITQAKVGYDYKVNGLYKVIITKVKLDNENVYRYLAFPSISNGVVDYEIIDGNYAALTVDWMAEHDILSNATIKYNNATIASVFEGQNAQLKCKGDNVKMLSDIEVKTQTKPTVNLLDTFLPSNIWSEADYVVNSTNDDDLTIIMKYKYKKDLNDPKLIPFVALSTEGYATSNLADFYVAPVRVADDLVFLINSNELSRILYDNIVIPIEFKVIWKNTYVIYSAVAEDFGAKRLISNGNVDTGVNYKITSDIIPTSLVPVITYGASHHLTWYHEYKHASCGSRWISIYDDSPEWIHDETIMDEILKLDIDGLVYRYEGGGGKYKKNAMYMTQFGEFRELVIDDKGMPDGISTEAEMTSLLATAEVGSVYKYTGTSTDTYENGALYIVEAVSE